MRISTLMLLAAFTAFSGCGEKSEPNFPPLVQNLVQKEEFNGLLPAASKKVTTEITLRKAALLDRSFLYGGSLQFASLRQEGAPEPSDLMAIALGQMPAEFRIIDDKLRLVTDSRIRFESDVNRPSRLIQEFKILKQDEETLTILADKASPVLDTALFGEGNKVPVRHSWIRTLEYSEADELFLIESSMELTDGSLAEVMETLTPREKVVPAGAKPIYADPALNEDAARFRFLAAGSVFIDHPEQGRIKTQMAERFLPKEGEPIRWYVTSNVPAAYLADVKNGVEAWNRYSRATGRADIVKFEGLLPAGVKIGDPRYNIIVWDNIKDAGSAYESQASDPLTGVQSHSLVYMPLAWVNIGKDYWKNAAKTEALNKARVNRVSGLLRERTFMGRKLPVNCVDSAHLHLTAASEETPEEFGRALLKAVLFHEIGHALGLDHNFKGSLLFNPDNKGSAFSHSIMDYNQYNEEASAFTSLDSADGPVMEYDRQILSVLYNEGKDIRESDPVLPACSDEEADSTDGGVDPLCLRYDIGSDPTKQALRSLELLESKEARNGRMTSLPSSIQRASQKLPGATTIDTLEKAKTAAAELVNSIKGFTSLYIGGSANSLAYQGSQALRSLYVARPGVLPEGYEESALRERALLLLEKVGSLTAFPLATREALAELRQALASWLAATPALLALPAETREKEISGMLKSFDDTLAELEASLFSLARTRFAGSLVHSATAPLSFHTRGDSTVDLELLVIGQLEQMGSVSAGAKERPIAERMAAAKALATYAKVPAAKEAGARLQEAVNAQIREARDARKREALRQLLEALAW
jgi:hypothetical protein